MTNIKYIGSRWNGQESGSLENLFTILAIEKLDMNMSGFWANLDGSINVHGQFERISHGFSIDTSDQLLLARFSQAYEDNRYCKDDEPVAKTTIGLMGLLSSQVEN